MSSFTSRHVALLSLALPLVLATALSGCLAIGLGAAAVGGCDLLDHDNDNVVSEQEFSAGLFGAWDTNDDGRLTEAELNAGTRGRDVYSGWSGAYAEWDADDNGSLSQAEFSAGVTARGGVSQRADSGCDSLGL